MDRRSFLRGAAASGMGMSLGLGPSFWARALAGPAQPGAGPYGPLRAEPDENGLLLPDGFTSRRIAEGSRPVPGTSYTWHAFPDGGACFPADDGGWVYLSNSENPPPEDHPLPGGMDDPRSATLAVGGVSAIRFGADGSVVDAYRVLGGSRSNCAGGVTPWGTWLSCEEWEAPASGSAPYVGGRVWECDPFGATPPVSHDALGRCKHEMAAIDPARGHVYLSEDVVDGRFYRFTPTAWGDLSAGTLEAMVVADDGAVSWVVVPDPAATSGALRTQVPEATWFNGGEGCVYDRGRVYLTTQGDDRVWVHDVDAQTMVVLYDATVHDAPVLRGVDNVVVSSAHDVYVAEDGGAMQVAVITPDLLVAPVLRIVDPRSVAFSPRTGPPIESEITGLAFSPDGNRLYLASQRGQETGILYEVTGPFRGGTLAEPVPEPTTTTSSTTTTTTAPTSTTSTTTSTRPPGTTEAPAATALVAATGHGASAAGPAASAAPASRGPLPAWAAAGAAGAGLLGWRARRRASPPTDPVE